MLFTLAHSAKITRILFDAEWSWVIEDASNYSSYEVTDNDVVMLCQFAVATTLLCGVAEASRHTNLDQESLFNKIAYFIERNIIVPASDNKSRLRSERSPDLVEKWSEFGWAAAANYHRYCYDFPFHENDEDGLLGTRTAMEAYSAIVPDCDRFKVTNDSSDVVALVNPYDVDFDEILLNDNYSANVHALLSLSFGVVKKIPCPWKGEPLCFRTSPSGGARHPTEGYYISLDQARCESRWFHIQVEPLCLARLCAPADISILHKLFPRHLSEAPFLAKSLIVLTSVWTRNMYRYREPRTFRSVHMDIGHMAATIEAIASRLNLSTYAHYGFLESDLAEFLGIDMIFESPQMVIAVGSKESNVL